MTTHSQCNVLGPRQCKREKRKGMQHESVITPTHKVPNSSQELCLGAGTARLDPDGNDVLHASQQGTQFGYRTESAR